MSKANRRYYRTIVLGVLALAALVWVAMEQFGIARQEMLQLFLGAVLIVGLVIAAAALLVALWMGLRKCLQRQRD